MPARETVAGEATLKSSTSKSSETWGVIRMRSPERSVSSLLSSSVVFWEGKGGRGIEREVKE